MLLACDTLERVQASKGKLLRTAVVVSLLACGKNDDATTGAGSATTTQSQASDGGLCATWPAAAMVGCFPKPAHGGSGGEFLCDGGVEYALKCSDDAAPDPGLDCRVAAIPPGGGPDYCCPCRR